MGTSNRFYGRSFVYLPFLRTLLTGTFIDVRVSNEYFMGHGGMFNNKYRTPDNTDPVFENFFGKIFLAIIALFLA